MVLRYIHPLDNLFLFNWLFRLSSIASWWNIRFRSVAFKEIRMNETPPAASDNDDAAAEADARAMKAALQQDVAHWANGRANASSPPLVPARPVGSANARVAAQAVAKVAPQAAPIAKPALPRGPFAMKYDGKPISHYVAERFRNGAR
jgi:hypothetical protein